MGFHESLRWETAASRPRLATGCLSRTMMPNQVRRATGRTTSCPDGPKLSSAAISVRHNFVVACHRTAQPLMSTINEPPAEQNSKAGLEMGGTASIRVQPCCENRRAPRLGSSVIFSQRPRYRGRTLGDGRGGQEGVGCEEVPSEPEMRPHPATRPNLRHRDRSAG